MEKFEMWDFIALGVMLLSFWVSTYGVKMCREADKEGFNEKSLRNKAWGAGLAGFLYLLIRLFA